jgi:hypothetical protein
MAGVSGFIPIIAAIPLPAVMGFDVLPPLTYSLDFEIAEGKFPKDRER